MLDIFALKYCDMSPQYTPHTVYHILQWKKENQSNMTYSEMQQQKWNMNSAGASQPITDLRKTAKHCNDSMPKC